MTKNKRVRRLGGGRRFRWWLQQLHDALVAQRAADELRAAVGGAEGSLLDWGSRLLPEHFRLPPSAMHRWLDAQLARCDRQRGCKLNAIGPRGSAKSTVATLAYVLRAALERREPYIWIVSDTLPQAAAHLENLKTELVENERLRPIYPDAVGRGAPWRSTSIGLANGVRIEAIGTGQRIRGRRRRAHRPTLIVCDDLQNDQHIDSTAQRERSRRWFHGTLLRAGAQGTNIVNLATALHQDALACELSRSPGWTSRTFRAIQHWPERMDLWNEWERLYRDVADPASADAATAYYLARRAAMDAGAELLWPESEDLLALMQMRVESGEPAFNREKQSAPIDPSRCEWPESYFAEPLWFDRWPARLQVKTMALDPSKGADARRGDDAAYVLLGLGQDGLWYVEADLRRRPTAEIVEDGVELHRRFNPQAFGIEANQFQDLLAPLFMEAFAAQGWAAVSPWLMHNYISKRVRIRRLGSLISQHRFRFKNDSPGTIKLVDQLRAFPESDHDDGPDALEMALRLAEELTRASPNDGLGTSLL